MWEGKGKKMYKASLEYTVFLEHKTMCKRRGVTEDT